MFRSDVADRAPGGASVFAWLSATATARYAVFLGFAVLLFLSWGRNVNWDEFYFLSHVHAFLDGRLDRPLQTVYVHAFGWLATIPGHEMGQIVIARLVMTGLLAVTCLSIFRMATALADRRAAWIALVAFLSSGFTLAHGTSFRADPIAAAGLMAALAILFTARLSVGQILAVAVLSAFALLVTIKAVLYFPAYLAVLIWRWREPGLPLRILTAWLLGLAIAAALFALHSAGIEAPADKTAMSNAQGALHTTLLQSGLFPRGRDALLWALLSSGTLALAWFGVSRAGARLGWLLLAFAAPLILSIVFYRNAFPYFFPFITPPLMIAAAVGAARLGSGPALGALMALMLASGSVQAIAAASESAETQRATLAEIHRLFPEPVPYIDQNAMVASFPRQSFFMSTWGILKYRAAGQPVMADLIAETQPPLLLTNRWTLDQAMTAPEITDSALSLLPPDQSVLRQSYVHYSGAIWLAGQTVTLGESAHELDLPVHGRYRVIADTPVRLAGETVQPEDTVELTGPVMLTGPAGGKVTLIWDTTAPQRPGALPQRALYAGFWQLPF
ncbi:hypothetical protein [Celeribacter neptunius]|uniref:Dolichyl-phosphate-mannose-protein mannosyltransferase n=1 Tax=Celeribacter neptunius TaxID=588602 RepID=A0A1I3PMS5_9RHOB|nr:hypothetical protein [Celeribacter neptunius]SFJ22802.1 hypothetical protein SAMN04487991_1734 [Celeribacter neptunius]